MTSSKKKSNSPFPDSQKKSQINQPHFSTIDESSGPKFRHVGSEFHGKFEFGTRLGPGPRNPARARVGF